MYREPIRQIAFTIERRDRRLYGFTDANPSALTSVLEQENIKHLFRQVI